jgi:two-component system, LytTR family, sensor kinase
MLQNWLKKQQISPSDIGILLLCAAFVFPFEFSGFARFFAQRGWFRGIFHVFSYYLSVFSVVVGTVYFILPYYLKHKKILPVTFILLGLLVIDAFLSKYIQQLICGCKLTINYNTLSNEMQYTVMIAAPVSMVLFIKRILDSQNRFFASEKEKKEAELKLLKQQLDPHFLFNNLNVLGVLIQKDTAAAHEYLQRFSNLYRYLIRHKDADVVFLEEELKFVEDYIYLLKQRFGMAYNFDAFNQLTSENVPHCMILPSAIQTLIENIMKHNQGEQSDPLPIFATITAGYFVIKNEIRPKYDPINSTKTGLKNLQTRYQLLSDKSIIINELDGFFEVKIPLLDVV